MGRVIDASASIWAFGAVPYGICSCTKLGGYRALHGAYP
ncbi:hypothetical protein CGLO_00001 [Colletotrichum gloeosporioides Cg-14]|uniref:Uncharacterized protein n=1 Tax=Colletotrichum gloeosporioides (strain Cg-14) TaxID=1237896 RepID=T0KVL8_COLGC|nr:hypothetical protein CGLO_00001 [Colletotrichum gloeosporioides Cg-14]